MTASNNTIVSGPLGQPLVTGYTAAQLTALAAAGGLTPNALYVTSDGVERYTAKTTRKLSAPVELNGLTTAQIASQSTGPIFSALPRGDAFASMGTIWANYSAAPGGGTVSPGAKITDLSEMSPDPDVQTTVVMLQGTVSQTAVYDDLPASALSVATINEMGFWGRATPRADGARYSTVLIYLCASAANFTDTASGNLALRADGVWRFYVFNPGSFTLTGAFAWASTTVARIRFREPAAASTGRPVMGTSDKIFFGPLRANPRQRPIYIPRFDDNYAVQSTSALVTVPNFTGNSGVVITSGTMSLPAIVEAFGFAATSYIITDLVGSSGFASVNDLLALQDSYGWDIGFQSKYNGLGYNNAGERMLGPLGYNLIQANTISNVNTGTGIFTWSGGSDHYIGGNTADQGFPIVPFGTNLPGGVTAGTRYFAYRASATTFSLHTTLQGGYDGTSNKIVPSTTGTYSDFGFRREYATNDDTALRTTYTDGPEWMRQQGFLAYRHYAPNQGAYDLYTESALFALNPFDTILGTTIQSTAVGYMGSSPVFDSIGHVTVLEPQKPVLIGAHSGVGRHLSMDTGGSGYGEATVRAWMRTLVRDGAMGSTLHHNCTSLVTNKDLLYALDEAKVLSDAGLLDVLTISQAYERIKMARAQLRVPLAVLA